MQIPQTHWVATQDSPGNTSGVAVPSSHWISIGAVSSSTLALRYPASQLFPTLFAPTPQFPHGPLAPDFPAAIYSILTADTVLMASLPGGLWHLEVPPRKPNPCGVYLIPTYSDEMINQNCFWQTGQLQITIHSQVADEASVISEYIDDMISNIMLTRRVEWYNGRLQYLERSNAPSSTAPTDGYAGSNVTGVITIYDYQFHGQRKLTAALPPGVSPPWPGRV